MRRKTLAIAASLLAVGAWLYHGYWPRERAGVPASDGPLASVLARSDLPYRAWLAYPHQNLGELEASPGWKAAVDLSTDLGLPRLALPSFGPLAAPPARALAVATDEAGERVVLAAEVYRLPALAARLAGRLANNPWLRGGRVETAEGAVEVTWQGRTWVVARGTTARGGKETVEASVPTSRRAIAAGVTGRRAGWLPPGSYLLARRGSALELTQGRVEGLRPFEPPPGSVAALAGRAAVQRVDALALLATSAASGPLPAGLVFHRGPGRRWSLPGESLHEMLGREPESREHGPWQVATTSGEDWVSAQGLLPYLDRLFGGAASDGARSTLWIDLPAARATLGPLPRELARLPIREARTLAAVAAALEGLAGWRSLSVLIVEGAETAVLARLDR